MGELVSDVEKTNVIRLRKTKVIIGSEERIIVTVRDFTDSINI